MSSLLTFLEAWWKTRYVSPTSVSRETKVRRGKAAKGRVRRRETTRWRWKPERVSTRRRNWSVSNVLTWSFKFFFLHYFTCFKVSSCNFKRNVFRSWCCRKERRMLSSMARKQTPTAPHWSTWTWSFQWILKKRPRWWKLRSWKANFLRTWAEFRKWFFFYYIIFKKFYSNPITVYHIIFWNNNLFYNFTFFIAEEPFGERAQRYSIKQAEQRRMEKAGCRPTATGGIPSSETSFVKELSFFRYSGKYFWKVH